MQDFSQMVQNTSAQATSQTDKTAATKEVSEVDEMAAFKQEIYEELAAFNENAMNSLTLGYSFNSENVATEVAAVTTVITQYLPALECGMVDDVDAAIATLNEELEKAGLSRIIEENQRQLNEWMANQ